MNYTRLTGKSECGYSNLNACLNCDLEMDCGLCPYWAKALDRLAELEDKIVNGTLIDTKVKIGQRVFRFGFFKGDFDEYIVSNIVLENGKLEIHLKHDYDEHSTCYSVTVLGIEEIGKTVFLTLEEAEARLKEIQK